MGLLGGNRLGFGLYQRLGARSMKQDEVDEVLEVRALGGMLTAVGEALFFFGGEKRLAAASGEQRGECEKTGFHVDVSSQGFRYSAPTRRFMVRA